MNDFQSLAEELLSKAATYTPETQRLPALEGLSDYIKKGLKSNQPIRLNFICTHNSRRSHFGQIMAQVLAAHLKLQNIETFSGGTEATAFHPNAVQALIDLEVSVEKLSDGPNPYYRVTTGTVTTEAFSKVFSDATNPKKNFAAIMVCSSADAGCPFVPGSDKRISLPFEDPKIADGTPQQTSVYRERAIQIGTELAWVFSRAVAN